MKHISILLGTSLLTLGLGCGDDDSGVNGACQTLIDTACQQVSTCTESSVSACQAQFADQCEGAIGPGPSYNDCLASLQGASCSEVQGFLATDALPGTCVAAIEYAE